MCAAGTHYIMLPDFTMIRDLQNSSSTLIQKPCIVDAKDSKHLVIGQTKVIIIALQISLDLRIHFVYRL